MLGAANAEGRTDEQVIGSKAFGMVCYDLGTQCVRAQEAIGPMLLH